jgi:hypothetical protein
MESALGPQVAKIIVELLSPAFIARTPHWFNLGERPKDEIRYVIPIELELNTYHLILRRWHGRSLHFLVWQLAN